MKAATGLVCRHCDGRFEESAALAACPYDAFPLLREADLAAAEGDAMLGRVLAGRFTILARIGAGSMGTVYRALQAPIGRQVAIKILRRDRAIDDASRARFLREARANSLLSSPNTVTVYDFGQGEGGEFFLAMELLEGESLGHRIRRLGRLDVNDALNAARQALLSLAEAHARGIIHRDLKPDNLFFSRTIARDTYQETVKILDFGIAKMMDAEGEPAMSAADTQAGMVFGTPRYMSPEQAQGKPLDARSDLYSLGVILYHMMTGVPPFADEDAIVVMARHIKTPPRPMSAVAPDALIPAEVEAAVMRVLSKEPEKRPQSAEAMMAEIARAWESAMPWMSGVQASLASGGIATVDGSRLASRSSGAPPSGASFASDTLSTTTVVPSSSRRGRLVVATLAFGAIALGALALGGALRRPVTTSAAATPASSLSRPSPTQPGITAGSIPAAPSPDGTSPALPGRGQTLDGTSPAAPGGQTLSNKIVEVPASALPRLESHQPRPARPRPMPATNTKPPPVSSVGYGYLE
jgi:serine/threonine protein kinase